MKILLVGEYSRLHNSLKEGLKKLGHDVTILGSNDGFKNYPVDLSIKKKFNHGFLKKFKNGLYLLFKYDLESQQIKKQILDLQPKISGFDVVQFINEASFGCTAQIEKDIFDLIADWNDTVFLLSCGNDYTSITHALEGKLKYSFLTPYFLHGASKSKDSYGLKFLEPEFKALHHHIYKRIAGVIASDIDYHIPLKNHSKYLGLIPNPINIEVLEHKPLDLREKIVIFHGINTAHYYKKGNDIFVEALKIIQKKYADKIEVITTNSIPYKDYIKAYDKAHIVLDMVYAYDQGYNALEAMAQGKVVFTGAESEWLEHYNIKADTIAINALPNAEAIAAKLERLISEPSEMINISTNARKFIETHHNYVSCARLYQDLWKSKM